MIEHEQIERLLEVNRLEEARTLVQSGFARTPDDPQLHYYAARIAWKRDGNEEAQEHVNLALSIDPHHHPARVLRFLLLLDARKYPEAELAVTELLREEPTDAQLLALYARLLLYTLHIDKSAALVREALRVAPDCQEARICQVLIATVRGQTDLARGAVSELIAEDPEASDVAFTLLHVLIHERRFGEALALGRELLRAQPDNQELIELLVELSTTTHWVALPAYPLNRWGGAASGAMWAGAVVLMAALRRTQSSWALSLSALYLTYVVYSWVHGPLLRRWLRYRGF